MNNEKMITEYVVIKNFPETETVASKDNESNVYKFDVLVGTQIPNNANINRDYIKELKFRFSPNTNTPGIQKSAIEVTKDIARLHEKLKTGAVYAKVSLFMSGRKNKAGVIDSYVPYINNVEFVETDDKTRPYVQAAIGADETPTF